MDTKPWPGKVAVPMRSAHDDPVALSPRQHEVAMLAGSMSYTAIADELGISYHTVLTHVREIVRRVGGPGESPQAVMARYRDDRRAA